MEEVRNTRNTKFRLNNKLQLNGYTWSYIFYEFVITNIGILNVCFSDLVICF